MSLISKLFVLQVKTWNAFTYACQGFQEFQQRIWIVSIQKNATEQGTLLNDTFVVSEDSFSSPMSWMHKRGYNEVMISKVDKMQRSKVVKMSVDDEFHSLIRVK